MRTTLFAFRRRAERMLAPAIMLACMAFSGLGCDTGYSGPSTADLQAGTKDFVYVTNEADNSVSAYAVSKKDGTLTPLGVTPTGQAPHAIVGGAVVGNPVYVVNQGSDTISQFKVRADGSLAPLSPPTVPTGHHPASIRYLAFGDFGVANQADNTVTVYKSNPDGTLTALYTKPTGQSPTDVAAGSGIYVADSGDNVLSLYRHDAASGLMPLSPPTVSAGLGASRILTNANGVYVANSLSNTISIYKDPSADSVDPYFALPLVPVDTAFSQGNNPQALVSFIRRYLVVVNHDSNNLTLFDTEIGDAKNRGGLTLIQAGIPTGQGPVAGAEGNVQGTGEYLYVVNQGANTLSAYQTVDTAKTGAFTLQQAQTVPTGHAPSSVLFVETAVNPNPPIVTPPVNTAGGQLNTTIK